MYVGLGVWGCACGGWGMLLEFVGACVGGSVVVCGVRGVGEAEVRSGRWNSRDLPSEVDGCTAGQPEAYTLLAEEC